MTVTKLMVSGGVIFLKHGVTITTLFLGGLRRLRFGGHAPEGAD